MTWGQGPFPTRPSRAARPQDPYARYKTVWARFAASFIDGLVLLPASIVAGAVRISDVSTLVLGIGLTVGYCAPWIYSILMHYRFGQTVGKMKMGVILLNVQEDNLPSFRQAVLRDLPLVILDIATAVLLFVVTTSGERPASELPGIAGLFILLSGGLWVVLELITLLSNPKRRALHDYIAGTVVVLTSDPRPMQERAFVTRTMDA